MSLGLVSKGRLMGYPRFYAEDLKNRLHIAWEVEIQRKSSAAHGDIVYSISATSETEYWEPINSLHFSAIFGR